MCRFVHWTIPYENFSKEGCASRGAIWIPIIVLSRPYFHLIDLKSPSMEKYMDDWNLKGYSGYIFDIFQKFVILPPFQMHFWRPFRYPRSKKNLRISIWRTHLIIKIFSKFFSKKIKNTTFRWQKIPKFFGSQIFRATPMRSLSNTTTIHTTILAVKFPCDGTLEYSGVPLRVPLPNENNFDGS